MRVSGVVMACVLTAAGAARGAEAADQFTPPDWLKRPTRQDLIGAWPQAAVKQGIDGAAMITCVVTVQGGLRDCKVASESPAGAGFGAAALALTPQFLFKPATHNGTPIESEISVPIHFPKLDAQTRASLALRTDNEHVKRALYRIALWEAAPTVADVAAAYPAKARQDNITGHATLDCRINRTLELDECAVLTEFPTGRGFGAAARSLSAKFKAPRIGEGLPLAGAHTNIPFTFSAETLSSTSPLIGRPEWSGTPTVEDFTAAFPKAAEAAGILKARAVLSCVVTSSGGVTGCSVTSEDPPGLGFGAATVGLADKFRLTNWTSEGLPTAGGRVTIPIRFELLKAPKAAAESAAR